MEEVNNNTELNDTDKKLHISDVMNSILNELDEREKSYTEKEFNRKEYDFYTRQQFSSRADEIRRIMEIVKKYCS
jgi:hypothetical protein